MNGRRLKAVDDLKGTVSKKKLADRAAAEQMLFTYQELNDQPPAWLDKVATKEWHRIVPLLKKDIPVSALDASLIAGHCQAYADMQHAAEIVKKSGCVIQGQREMRANPAVKIQRDATSQMIKIDDCLGLSVYSRMKLAIKDAGKQPDDPFAKLVGNE